LDLREGEEVKIRIERSAGEKLRDLAGMLGGSSEEELERCLEEAWRQWFSCDANILYHMLHKTLCTGDALALLEEDPGGYVIDTTVHDGIIYASTFHYLEHRYNVRRTLLARKWVRKHGYPAEVLHAVGKLVKKP